MYSFAYDALKYAFDTDQSRVLLGQKVLINYLAQVNSLHVLGICNHAHVFYSVVSNRPIFDIFSQCVLEVLVNPPKPGEPSYESYKTVSRRNVNYDMPSISNRIAPDTISMLWNVNEVCHLQAIAACTLPVKWGGGGRRWWKCGTTEKGK